MHRQCRDGREPGLEQKRQFYCTERLHCGLGNGRTLSASLFRQAAGGSRTPEALQAGDVNGSSSFRVGLDLHERTTSMPDFMTEWWFLILMAVILVALIGLLLFLRNKRPED